MATDQHRAPVSQYRRQEAEANRLTALTNGQFKIAFKPEWMWGDEANDESRGHIYCAVEQSTEEHPSLESGTDLDDRQPLQLALASEFRRVSEFYARMAEMVCPTR